MSDELKPCPACPDGGEPVRGMSSVWCKKCGLQTFGANIFATDEEIIASWNKRPIEDALLARAEQAETDAASLRETLKYYTGGKRMSDEMFDKAIVLDPTFDDLCWNIEKFPASNLQTQTITMACDIKQKYVALLAHAEAEVIDHKKAITDLIKIIDDHGSREMKSHASTILNARKYSNEQIRFRTEWKEQK